MPLRQIIATPPATFELCLPPRYPCSGSSTLVVSFVFFVIYVLVEVVVVAVVEVVVVALEVVVEGVVVVDIQFFHRANMLCLPTCLNTSQPASKPAILPAYLPASQPASQLSPAQPANTPGQPALIVIFGCQWWWRSCVPGQEE